LKAAYNRLVLDNLQYITDPKAQQRFKQKYAKSRKNGSPYWLPPGTFTPAGRNVPQMRAPDFASALRSSP
jgi:hypothetical protein